MQLRFDRYLAHADTLIDLATGAAVECRWRRGDGMPALFTKRGDRILIDLVTRPRGCFEIWDRSWADVIVDLDDRNTQALVEALESARHGAPRIVRIDPRPAHEDSVVRQLARQARERGWVPIGAAQLAAATGSGQARWPRWLQGRTLVVFMTSGGLQYPVLTTLARLAGRDARPHVVVVLGASEPFVLRNESIVCHDALPAHRSVRGGAVRGGVVRERTVAYLTSQEAVTSARESRARWDVMLSAGSSAAGPPAAIDLAHVLIQDGRRFEARALLRRPQGWLTHERRRQQLLSRIDRISRATAARALGRRSEMVEDFVGVLRLCQDTEDERVALSRVGAYLRERLQASTVAFVVRDGPRSRAIALAGLDPPAHDTAMTAIESGCAIAATSDAGPAESAAPVRYAADVIGALSARWSAGVPVSPQDASALLGVAAVAAAPSLRGVLDRERPIVTAAIPELVGQSVGIRSVREAVVRAASAPFPVLIEGESGVGKELVARAIHAGSGRRERRFSAINCAALVDELVEAELFGHSRGAFTSAHAERPGLFEEASGGTLFLDEVGELGSRVQAKLLRTLQEGEVRRIGESITRRVDVRIVAATNRPLATEVNGGRFRRDLWYRLDVLRITVPPVRERLEDIPLLARHAWNELAARTGSRATLSGGAIAALAAYDWPGNVRELQNVLASMLVSAPRRGLVGASSLPTHITRAAALAPASTLDAARTQFETRFVRAALARANGRLAVAARELGLSRQGLAKLLTRLGLAASGAPKETPEGQIE